MPRESHHAETILAFLRGNNRVAEATKLAKLWRQRPMEFVAKGEPDRRVLATMRSVRTPSGMITHTEFLRALGLLKQDLWRMAKYGSTRPKPAEPLPVERPNPRRRRQR